MGDWPRLVNLRRCARGHISDSGESNNTTLALTNDSTGAELLLVWQLIGDSGNNGAAALSYQQGFTLTPGGIITPVVPGDAPPPGVLSSGDLPLQIPPDWTLGTEAFALGWAATFPFAVLLPGWALVLQQPGGVAGAFGQSFFWEAILPKYFDRMHTHYYLELALAQQGG